MKKSMPWIRCAGFLVGLAVILGICDFCFAPSGYVRFILHEVNRKDTQYDTIILGASHARSAINPEYLDEELGTNTLNLAIPGETVKDAYYLLKDACESNDVKTVIMDVDYQYWMDEQPQGYFTEPFICQNITNLKVKTEYLLDNWDTIDLRNVLVRRLSWDCTWSSVKQNVSTKMTEAYREYSIEAAGVDGKVEGQTDVGVYGSVSG